VGKYAIIALKSRTGLFSSGLHSNEGSNSKGETSSDDEVELYDEDDDDMSLAYRSKLGILLDGEFRSKCSRLAMAAKASSLGQGEYVDGVDGILD
jgi:hypothetical protein